MHLTTLLLLLCLASPLVLAAAPDAATAEQLAAGDALMGWDKVTWGQTKEEVKKAYPLRLRDRDEKVMDKRGMEVLRPSLWMEPVLIENLPMRIHFQFSETLRALNAVAIDSIRSPTIPKDYFSRSCGALEAHLVSRYGPARHASIEPDTGSWHLSWSFRGTGIRLYLMKGSGHELMCRLTYSARGIATIDPNRPD